MCLIIVKPANTAIPSALLNSAIDHNPDGYGIMYAHDGRIKVSKGLDYSRLKSKIKKLEDKDLIVHLRMATHGIINRDNCHPFKVNKNLYFCHNGILRDFIPQDDTVSDTVNFNRSVLIPDLHLDPDLVFNANYVSYLESLIGKYNKLAFMDSGGRIQFVNRDHWIEWEGLLLSNDYAYDVDIIGGYDPLYYDGYHDPYINDYDTLESLRKSSLQDIEDLAYTDPQYLARLVYKYFNR